MFNSAHTQPDNTKWMWTWARSNIARHLHCREDEAKNCILSTWSEPAT